MQPDAVVAQLEKILASASFAQSKRLSRFLRLIVQETLTGKPDGLKEYRIGTEVFDRGTDFDPRIDSIVRVQAAKLRSKLIEYYAGEGVHDTIVIRIPRGSYAPEIQFTNISAAPAVPMESPAPSPARSR